VGSVAIEKNSASYLVGWGGGHHHTKQPATGLRVVNKTGKSGTPLPFLQWQDTPNTRAKKNA
jgi:hypothetical protein